MSRFVVVFFMACLLASLGARAQEVPTQRKVELENQIRDRVQKIVATVDSQALVQVNVEYKKVTSDLPGMGFGAEVIPVEADGRLGSASISSVEVRILTKPEKAVPNWVRKEVEKTLKLGKLRVKISYEQFKGEVKRNNGIVDVLEKVESEFLTKFVKQEVFETIKNFSLNTTNGMSQMKLAMYALAAGVFVSLLLLTGVIFMVVRDAEKSMIRVIEDKLMPVLAASRAAQPTARERVKNEGEQKPIEIQMPASPGQRELADLPVDTILNLMSDCYWTHSDGYAHWLWTQMTQVQRETVLSSKKVDPKYYAYIRQFEPKNLMYHNDARYLSAGGEFSSLDQADLAEWVRKNQSQFHLITPLRWDHLPLALPERIEFMVKPAGSDFVAKGAPIAKASTQRKLPMKLEVKTLSVSDENYIFENSAVIPVEARSSLKSLVWLALAPADYRMKVLSDIDARGLAEAWVGPQPVLDKLREAIPNKKMEMVDHFLKETTPDRESETFEFLVEAGLEAVTNVDDNGAVQIGAAA